jgi:serpin B
MNDRIKEMTGGKITELISARELEAEQPVLSIVNAIYFKNMWIWPFNAARTYDQDFIGIGGSRTKVPMMLSSENFFYMEEESFQAIAMPYKGWETSMVVFLPKKVDGLQEFEESLTSEKLTASLGKLAQCPYGLRVTLPKFTSRSRRPLAPTLQEMGMKTAFGPRADFSGIREKKRSKTPDDLLFITSVLHEAWTDVNERGTEAAAATALKAAAPVAKPVQEPKVFRADHPFMFIIRHKPTGCILFMGRVTNPAAS